MIEEKDIKIRINTSIKTENSVFSDTMQEKISSACNNFVTKSPLSYRENGVESQRGLINRASRDFAVWAIIHYAVPIFPMLLI